MSKLKVVLKILLTPTCWIRNYATSPHHDTWLRDALEDPDIESIGPHTCKLNGKTIWISNYPYCYGYDFHASGSLPSRATVFRLKDAVDAEICSDRPATARS